MLDADTPQVLDEKGLARKMGDERQRRQGAREFTGFSYVIKRVLVRTTRIAVGFIIGVLSLWPLEFAFKAALEQPLASLSPLNVIVSGLAAVLGIAAVVWAPRIAFGEGESRKMLDARLEGEKRVATGPRSRQASPSTTITSPRCRSRLSDE